MTNVDLATDTPTDAPPTTDANPSQPTPRVSDTEQEGSPAHEPTASNENGAAKNSSPRRVSINVRSLAVSALILVLAVAVGVLGWLYTSNRNELDVQARRNADRQHAEQIASDYAVNAAALNYKTLTIWKQNLVKGTTPELKDKLQKAADSMEQILVPLEWDSASSALAARVRSESNGIYSVDTFVSVLTKSVQARDGLQSTATYRVTIDSNNNWLISDVGGIDAVIGPR